MKVDGTWLCPDEAKAQGLTILDLNDAWTPKLLSGEGDTVPVFREKYLALAQDRSLDGKPLPHEDELAELYGVVPSLSIVRTRLADDARHACNAAIDASPIALLDKPYAQDYRARIKAMNFRRVALEKKKANEAPPDSAQYKQWKALDDMYRGILAAQQKLVCEGYLTAKEADGQVTWRTSDAVELYQRRNFLMPNERLDDETREAMQLDSLEHDFRLALRILRERVVDATGLIEDGTASTGPQPILGRMLDPKPMRAARGVEKAMENGAGDLVSAATETAAKALGWTDAASVRAFLERFPTGARFAVALPPPPAYHSAHMDLVAEIDRGDVWYDETPIKRKIRQRPKLVLYVNDGDTKRPLIRWPTTIGGWSDVRMPGGWVAQKWKESDVGPRVWRRLYAAPTWMPPPSTPDRDLVRNTYRNGKWELKTSIMGPGPHAAYGLVLLQHDNVVQKKDGSVSYWNNGIGTHGSASVTSIVNGTSHGCHRLYNQLAVRLADFLLAHRTHTTHGEEKVNYVRRVNHKGSFVARVSTRGFLYEMTPPVPITVLKGNIKSTRKVPPKNSAAARPD